MSDGSTFGANDTTAVLGYALSTSPPVNKADHATDLVYHDTMGNYGMDLLAARGLWTNTSATVMRRREVLRTKLRGQSAILGVALARKASLRGRLRGQI